MDLEGIILSEMSQTEKDKYHVILLTCESKKQMKLSGNKLRYREHFDGYHVRERELPGMGGKGEGIEKYKLMVTE